MKRRLWSLLTIVVALCLAATACSTGQDQAGKSAAPGVGREVVPTVLEAVVSRELFVEKSGSDSNNGRSQATAVASLDRALDLAQAGDTIWMGAGVWRPIAIRNRTFSDLVRIRGRVGTTVIRDTNYDNNAGILIADSRNVSVEGFTVEHSLWSIRLYRSSYIRVINNHVRDVGQEAIAVTDNSHHVDVIGNEVHDTGNRPKAVGPFPHANGEGIYIGKGTGGENQNVHNVRIANNHIYDTSHEAIDIKRPSHHIVVEDNLIHDIDTFTSGAVVVHIGTHSSVDPNIVIRRNVIHDVTRTSQYRDGNCITLSAAARVENNVLYNCQHRGVFVDQNFPNANNRNVTIVHNTIFNTGMGGVEKDNRSPANVTVSGNLGANWGSGQQNLDVSASAFADAAGGDFRLSATAPLGRAPQGLVSDDITKRQRPVTGPIDHGAYQVSNMSVAITTTTAKPTPTTTKPTATTAKPTTTTTKPTATTAKPTPTTTKPTATTAKPTTSTTKPTATTAKPTTSTTGPSTTGSSTTGSSTTGPGTSAGSSSTSGTASTTTTVPPTPDWCTALGSLCESWAPLL